MTVVARPFCQLESLIIWNRSLDSDTETSQATDLLAAQEPAQTKEAETEQSSAEEASDVLFFTSKTVVGKELQARKIGLAQGVVDFTRSVVDPLSLWRVADTYR